MTKDELVALIAPLSDLARHAGAEIMTVYKAGMVQKDLKDDGSPVTEADRRADKIIQDGLSRLTPEIALISEEKSESHQFHSQDRFWLVDPLDGTKEFLKHDGKGSFTVNIALIEDGHPVLGIVFAPALDRLFAGVVGKSAQETCADRTKTLTVRPCASDQVTAVASASHRDAETDKWLSNNKITNTVSIGSSLKFCLLAAGEADVYPRFGPTMEWDTAAGDAVLRAAGGLVTHPDKTLFTYGKTDLRNGPFIAYGDQSLLI